MHSSTSSCCFPFCNAIVNPISVTLVWSLSATQWRWNTEMWLECESVEASDRDLSFLKPSHPLQCLPIYNVSCDLFEETLQKPQEFIPSLPWPWIYLSESEGSIILITLLHVLLHLALLCLSFSPLHLLVVNEDSVVLSMSLELHI